MLNHEQKLNKTDLPTIIVVAYNRVRTLNRLLKSLTASNYTGYNHVRLVISIDKSDRSEVAELAHRFIWPFGEKKVLLHSSNLGLKKHILSCGDLTRQYGSVILLEDDLFVSPDFFQYSSQALKTYGAAPEVAGISLYSYDFNEYAESRFCPLDDGYDNYFIQTASSWGQMWTASQWSSFRQWYGQEADKPWRFDDGTPQQLQNWPASSWKKYFIKYLVKTGKYFVFPRVSLSTNFSTAGTNHRGNCSNFQVPLMMGQKQYKFSQLAQSLCVYDSHYELTAQCIKIINPKFSDMDFECDLYGTKNLTNVASQYLFSSRYCSEAKDAFGLSLVPQELNILHEVEGGFFKLGATKDFGSLEHKSRSAHLKYLHKNLGWRRYIRILSHTLANRLSTYWFKTP